MPNWDNDDPPPGCTRGDWGPNFCNCSACSAERAQQQRLQDEVDAEYRRQGIDPQEPVMPIMVGVDFLTYATLRILAGRQGVDVEVFVTRILKAVMETARKKGIVP